MNVEHFRQLAVVLHEERVRELSERHLAARRAVHAARAERRSLRGRFGRSLIAIGARIAADPGIEHLEPARNP